MTLPSREAAKTFALAAIDGSEDDYRESVRLGIWVLPAV